MFKSIINYFSIESKVAREEKRIRKRAEKEEETKRLIISLYKKGWSPADIAWFTAAMVPHSRYVYDIGRELGFIKRPKPPQGGSGLPSIKTVRKP